MSQYLPTGGFRWMTKKEINLQNRLMHKEDSKKKLILEVGLEYPQDLHNLHNDYPLGPAENVKVTENILPEHYQKVKNKYGKSIGQVHKLIPTLKCL